MISVRIKKGYNLNIQGKPSTKLETASNPTHVAAVPERIPFIKPKLQVRIGDSVSIGSVLLFDKKRPDLKFLSPGGGKVVDIQYGDRRIIKQIIIELSKKERKKKLPSLTPSGLKRAKKETIINVLMQGGVWPFIKALPFREIASPGKTPHSIWVSLAQKDPFQPDPETYLKDQEELFAFGMTLLTKLCPDICVISPANNHYLMKTYKKYISHTFNGNYPVEDPGVILYHTKKSLDENYAWYINGQDLLLLAQMVKTGHYPTDRIYAVSGAAPKYNRHVRARLGVKIDNLIPGTSKKKGNSYITGGIFRGYIAEMDSYMGLYETSLQIISKQTDKDFLGFLNPGFDRASYSRTFLSTFNFSPMHSDSSMHGEERACINCGSCAEVCAVDILPQFMFKSLQAEEVEEALSHGLLDCVECGLCAYVCPSKIELTAEFIKQREAYYEEALRE